MLHGANLHGAVLAGAVLAGADLRGADLAGADLRRADLRGADLAGAVLRGADLRGAVLIGAVLSGARGLVELPVADPRGYRLIAVQQPEGGEWLLYAGCRGPWTIAEARAHWGADGYDGGPLIARRYMHALDWWEREGETYRDAARGEGR